MSSDAQPPTSDRHATPAAEPLVVRPPDEIDPATAVVLDEALAEVDPSGATVVDFAAVSFCDSSGIRVLIAHATRHRDAGGSFGLVSVTPPVRRVFDLVGVAELLGVESA